MNDTPTIKKINTDNIILDKYYINRFNYIKRKDNRFNNDIEYDNFIESYNKLFTYNPYKIYTTDHAIDRYKERFKDTLIENIVVDIVDFITLSLMAGYDPENNKMKKRFTINIRNTNYVLDIKKNRIVIVTMYNNSNEFDIKKYRKFIKNVFHIDMDSCDFNQYFTLNENIIILNVDYENEMIYYVRI